MYEIFRFFRFLIKKLFNAVSYNIKLNEFGSKLRKDEVFKPHTHKLYILRHYITIIYLLAIFAIVYFNLITFRVLVPIPIVRCDIKDPKIRYKRTFDCCFRQCK